MNIKTQLHTLYVKHDGQFKTLSKIALAQVILKLIFFKGDGILMKQIKAELNDILIGNVPQSDIDDSINVLKRENKIHVKSGRHFIHQSFRETLQTADEENKKLHEFVLSKYFGGAESNKEAVITWFQETTIKFFETFSFEWFSQVAYKNKQFSSALNLREKLTEVLEASKCIVEADKEWLKKQYNAFIESDGREENLLFWQYGISMFSSRLITARNFADDFTIETFRNAKFILDTNVLMILDLEGHELTESLTALEKVLQALNIKTIYFRHTREEYLRAMNWRKGETIRVFENYNLTVLAQSDCPFIITALKRNCREKEDLERMFDELMDIPNTFHGHLPLRCLEYSELDDAIILGQQDSDLKDEINKIYKKRLKHDKRENPLIHDAGLISGAKFLVKGEKAWIVTNDSTLKLFALQNTVRDEDEIAVGLDVIIGVMALNSGGINVEASNFAPLFKNLIKQTLVPESTAFESQDLAFILNSNTKVNQLPDEAVVEAAKRVKRMRLAGEPEEAIALYLRRIIEGEKLEMIKDMDQIRQGVQLAKTEKEKVERENGVLLENYRERRRGELRDLYDKKLRWSRIKMISIPLLVVLLSFYNVKYLVPNQNLYIHFFSEIIATVVFGVLPLIPVNKRLVRKHSEYVRDINSRVEREISELRKKAS